MEYMDTFIFNSIFIMIAYLANVIITVVFWVFVIKLITNAIKRKNNHNYFKNNVVVNNKIENKGKDKYFRVYNDVSKNELAKFNTDDIDGLKDYFYNIFVDFENAYNNLDYNIMKLLSTKELYNNYYTGISLDLKVGRKRVISDIERKKVIIFELDSTIAKQIASLMIEISYINYTIDKHGYVVSGSRDNKVTERFEVIFRKDFERKEIVKCSNCGAEITGDKCDYCRSAIRKVEFKIGSIRKIIDK